MKLFMKGGVAVTTTTGLVECPPDTYTPAVKVMLVWCIEKLNVSTVTRWIPNEQKIYACVKMHSGGDFLNDVWLAAVVAMPVKTFESDPQYLPRAAVAGVRAHVLDWLENGGLDDPERLDSYREIAENLD